MNEWTNEWIIFVLLFRQLTRLEQKMCVDISTILRVLQAQGSTMTGLADPQRDGTSSPTPQDESWPSPPVSGVTLQWCHMSVMLTRITGIWLFVQQPVGANNEKHRSFVLLDLCEGHQLDSSHKGTVMWKKHPRHHECQCFLNLFMMDFEEICLWLFLDVGMAQQVEIFSSGTQGCAYIVVTVPRLLMTWWGRVPGHRMVWHPASPSHQCLLSRHGISSVCMECSIAWRWLILMQMMFVDWNNELVMLC